MLRCTYTDACDEFLHHSEFGVQDTATGGSDNGVVSAQGQFHVEHIAGAHPSYGNRKASTQVPIKPRLRTIWCLIVDNVAFRSAW